MPHHIKDLEMWVVMCDTLLPQICQVAEIANWDPEIDHELEAEACTSAVLLLANPSYNCY